jgi:hypothetical protein
LKFRSATSLASVIMQPSAHALTETQIAAVTAYLNSVE